MMKLKALGLLLLLISMIQSVAANELYRWQDEKGQWHFGDSASASLRSDVKVVHTASETANFIKTTKSKNLNKKAVKMSKNLSRIKTNWQRIQKQISSNNAINSEIVCVLKRFVMKSVIIMTVNVLAR
jgi:negative regulator of replication initiation